MAIGRRRRDYRGQALLESRSPAEPFALLGPWLAAAARSGNTEPMAMTLATVDARGRPHARMVLLKGSGHAGFTFYTNLASAKSRELARQIRIEGRARSLPARDADTYFATRPRDAQLGAWASPQSLVIRSRALLE